MSEWLPIVCEWFRDVENIKYSVGLVQAQVAEAEKLNNEEGGL